MRDVFGHYMEYAYPFIPLFSFDVVIERNNNLNLFHLALSAYPATP